MTCSKRLYSLDLIKTAAIICICALHFPWCGDIEFHTQMTALGAVRRFFFAFNSCAVPLFMAVNGALLLNRPFDAKKHLKNTVMLFLQYIFWRAVTVIAIFAYTGSDFSAYNLTTWVNELLFLNDLIPVRLNHLWFMPMLICIYVWLPLLKAAFDRLDADANGLWLIWPFMGAIVIFGFLFEDFTLVSHHFPVLEAAKLGGWQLFLPLSGSRYCSMLFYFIMGGLLLKYKDRLNGISSYIFAALIALSLVLLYIEWHFESSYSGDTYDNVFLSYDNLPCLLLTGSVFVLGLRCEGFLAGRKKLCAVFKAVGSNTMSVYYFHWILASTVFEYLHVADGLLFNFLKGALLTAICVLISLVFKKIPVLKRLVH